MSKKLIVLTCIVIFVSCCVIGNIIASKTYHKTPAATGVSVSMTINHQP